MRRVDEERFADVERYLPDLLVPQDEALIAAATAPGLPPHAVSPPEGKLLYLLARLCRARSILEVGTLAGYSTIWMARALPPGGRLVTIDVDAERAEAARRNLAAAGLSDVVEVRCGPALDVLPELEREGRDPFDLVFLDADKPNNPAYIEWALRLTTEGSVIVADNVVRGGAVTDRESDDPNVRGVRRFLEIVAEDPRLDATALQTVGSKGHDGFALALVRPGFRTSK
jgi:predicted O-methyltransferase YrrM